jgi:gallate dioxygenase
MNPQLEGVEAIEGTYPFDVRTSVERYRINRFCWNMAKAEFRARFALDEEGTCRQEGLSDAETKLVLARDWLGLVQHGTNFFVLEKFARLVGRTNLEVYAEMRGETFDQFMATRKVPEAR